MNSFRFRNHSISDFPEHLDIILVADWHLTDLTPDVIVIPPGECGLVIDSDFEVKFGSADFGVHKKHLVRLEILDNILSVFGIEPKLSV